MRALCQVWLFHQYTYVLELIPSSLYPHQYQNG
jgi:hypothetical protein